MMCKCTSQCVSTLWHHYWLWSEVKEMWNFRTVRVQWNTFSEQCCCVSKIWMYFISHSRHSLVSIHFPTRWQCVTPETCLRHVIHPNRHQVCFDFCKLQGCYKVMQGRVFRLGPVHQKELFLKTKPSLWVLAFGTLKTDMLFILKDNFSVKMHD